MKKYILPLLLLFISQLAAQPKIADTIRVVTLQQFKVPENRQIVLTNIRSIDFTAELLNANFIKLRDCENVTQFPSSEELPGKVRESGGRGVMVQYEVNESIDEVGVYYVKIGINFRDEQRSRSATAHYMVIVDYPTMSSNIDVFDRYYPSEKETFSFQTVEFADPMGYSYEIVDAAGTHIDSGRGAVVSLDEVFKDDKNVGREFTVIGKYHGKDFKYVDAGDKNEKESKWNFLLAPPNLDEFVTWRTQEQEEENKDELYISAYNANVMRFLYVYIGQSGDGSLVVIPPKIRGLRVESEPREFLTGSGARAVTQGNFAFVFLDINNDFLDQMETCGEMPIRLKFRFNTQYEKNIQKEYTATIIK